MKKVILSGKEKDIKKFLKKEKLWLKRNKVDTNDHTEESREDLETELNKKKGEILSLNKKIKKLQGK